MSLALGVGQLFVIHTPSVAISEQGVPTLSTAQQYNNKNNTVWGGSVLTSEEPQRNSGELNHALSQVGGPTESQLSCPMSSVHHISMEHRLRRKHQQSNSDTNASETFLKKIKKKERRNFFFKKKENEKKT